MPLTERLQGGRYLYNPLGFAQALDSTSSGTDGLISRQVLWWHEDGWSIPGFIALRLIPVDTGDRESPRVIPESHPDTLGPQKAQWRSACAYAHSLRAERAKILKWEFRGKGGSERSKHNAWTEWLRIISPLSLVSYLPCVAVGLLLDRKLNLI